MTLRLRHLKFYPNILLILDTLYVLTKIMCHVCIYMKIEVIPCLGQTADFCISTVSQGSVWHHINQVFDMWSFGVIEDPNHTEIHKYKRHQMSF